MLCSFTLAAQLSTTDVPMCSHQEATQGLFMDFAVTIFTETTFLYGMKG